MKTILIVDDQERIRRTYGTIFRKEGYVVLEAKDSDEADELVEQHAVDLMLLDLKMPEVDGTVLYEVTKLFQKDLKVIVTSVYPLDDQKYLIEGADDYFDKSESVQVLREKVRKVLFGGSEGN